MNAIPTTTAENPLAREDLNVRIFQGEAPDGRPVPEARLRLREGRRPDMARLLNQAVIAVRAEIPEEERFCWRVRSELLGDAEGRVYFLLEEGTLAEHAEGTLALHRAFR